jgi:hypothetical protein
MRGTGRIGSLLRLFVCAAFLCLAWVLFSSANAEAAERPAPSAVVASAADPLPAPVSETVDAATDSLQPVAEAVPALHAPVAVVADAAMAVLDEAAVVGRDPLAIVPLPDPSEVPLPVKLPEPGAPDPQDLNDRAADSPATQGDSPPSADVEVVPRGLTLASFDSAAARSVVRCAAGPEAVASRAPTPEPTPVPGPLSTPQAPMPPTSSVSGGGASSGDLASLGETNVLPHPTLSRSSHSGWRVPRGLPDRPGSRPG